MTPAKLDLSFERRGDRTVLARRVFRWPYVVMRPFWLDAAPAHMATVIVQSSSGALQRGDRLRQRIFVGANAAAHVTTQGAQAVHAAAGGLVAEEATALEVAAGGYLEYLPEARVLFPGADLISSVDVDCAREGVVLVGDAFTCHDPERAGRWPDRYRLSTRIRIAGGPAVSIDRADIADFAPRGSAFAAFGGMALAAPERGVAEAIARLNRALGEVGGLYAAASALPGDIGVGVRFAGRELRDVRVGLRLAWRYFRTHLTGAAPDERRRD